MENKFTPGPWKYTHQINKGVISIHEGDSPEEIEYQVDYIDPTICGLWYTDYEKSLANAKLIAAAPDLLECLQEISAVLSVFGGKISQEQYDKINNTINKATL